jgi:hypothetical protein
LTLVGGRWEGHSGGNSRRTRRSVREKRVWPKDVRVRQHELSCEKWERRPGCVRE